MRTLVAIPVFNEARYVRGVLSRVRAFANDILVVDDGSTDGTSDLLAEERDIHVIRHDTNIGYGRSIRDAFGYSVEHGYELLITMDCDEQHEPQEIPAFMRAASNEDADVISGSRYLRQETGDDVAPADRRRINATITEELNERIGDLIGCEMTDSFCGFKAYRTSAIAKLTLDDDGYAIPMQFWIQAAAHRLRVIEIPVRRIYQDMNRSFGGALDDAAHRLAHYREVMHAELCRCRTMLSEAALDGLVCGCER